MGHGYRWIFAGYSWMGWVHKKKKKKGAQILVLFKELRLSDSLALVVIKNSPSKLKCNQIEFIWIICVELKQDELILINKQASLFWQDKIIHLIIKQLTKNINSYMTKLISKIFKQGKIFFVIILSNQKYINYIHNYAKHAHFLKIIKRWWHKLKIN